MSIYMLLISLLFSISVYAKEVWIGAAGMSSEKWLNHADFYNQLMLFYNKCQSAGIHKENCKIFVDTDINKLRPDANPQILTDLSKVSLGQATSKELLYEFKTALQQARSGEQIVFSLLDHGAPGILASSCVFLNSQDKICEDDLKKIIDKEKKPGVKIFIQTDACFSGGFASLQNKEVCIAVHADEFNFSVLKDINAPTISFWSNKGDYLKDYKVPLSKFDGYKPILGSQYILLKKCESFADNFTDRNNNPELEMMPLLAKGLKIIENKKNRCAKCEDDAITNYLPSPVVLNRFYDQFKFYNKKYCATINTDNALLCKPLKRLLDQEEYTKNTLRQVKNLVNQKIQIQNQFYDEIENLNDLISKEKKSKTVNKLNEKKIKLALEKSKTQALKNVEIEQKLDELKISEDLEQVLECTASNFNKHQLENAAAETKNKRLLNYFIKQRKYTFQDYQDAKECENSFRL